MSYKAKRLFMAWRFVSGFVRISFEMRVYLIGLIFVLAVASVRGAVMQSFSRYALILDRRPFGTVSVADEMPPVVTVDKPPAFVKDLRMCAITESPAGVRVGFVNIRAKPPQPYYLYVGDSEDGIELVEAQYELEKALVRKGGEQYWLHMGGGAPSTGGSLAATPVTKPRPFSSRRGRMPVVSPPVANTSSPGNISYAERRRRRLEEMRRRAEEKQNLSEEEVEKRLQEYQMDLIRKGLTPLPIQLTPEMDAKLVAEGVLPPVDAEAAEGE